MAEKPPTYRIPLSSFPSEIPIPVATEMSLTRSAIHRFRHIIYHTPVTHTFQSQRHRSFLSHPIPIPFHFHSSSCSTFVHAGDDHYPTGDFDFKPVTGFNKFLVKLKMLIALPWERVQHGSILKIILRGQVLHSL